MYRIGRISWTSESESSQMIVLYDTDDSSIMSKVPTDAQLTIHLLRVAEALETPLPVPP
jgi:hypothetical protein